MKLKYLGHVAAAGLLLGTLGCADLLGTSAANRSTLADEFTALPVGYSSVLNTYASAQGPREGGPGGAARGMMGGGVSDLFLGAGSVGGFGRGHHGGGLGIGWGCGFGHWPFGDGFLDGTCVFNAASGRVVCEPLVRDGLTTNRSVAYTTAAGVAQAAYDTITTNTINTRIAVTGTSTRRDSATVNHASERTVSGLAKGSTQRVVNGTSAGRETSARTDSIGRYTLLRVVGDTTRNVTIPVTTESIQYPISGTIVRSMLVTKTYASGAPTTSTRREVITYDGTNTAKVVITKDGVTQNCTIPLPRGRPTCQ